MKPMLTRSFAGAASAARETIIGPAKEMATALRTNRRRERGGHDWVLRVWEGSFFLV